MVEETEEGEFLRLIIMFPIGKEALLKTSVQIPLLAP